MNKISKLFLTQTLTKTSGLILLVLVAALGRLIPHPWNMTPLLASGICGAAYFSRWGLLVPLLALLISDLVIGFYSTPMMLAVYGSVLAGAALVYVLKERASKTELVLVSIAGSTLFFLTTNAAVWFFGTMYPHTLPGLMAAYTAGLPFFRNALVGDVLFTVLIASVIELALFSRFFPASRCTAVHAAR